MKCRQTFAWNKGIENHPDSFLGICATVLNTVHMFPTRNKLLCLRPVSFLSVSRYTSKLQPQRRNNTKIKEYKDMYKTKYMTGY